MPFGLIWSRCPECRHRFWTLKRYQGHYALVHILGLREGEHPGITA